MGHPRKIVVVAAAGLAGVLGMAGVAAAAHGSSHGSSLTTETVHQHEGRDDATTTTGISGVTTTTEVEHRRPEPGDDNGQDASEHAAKTAAAANAHEVESEPGDDNGHDANDNDNDENTTTTMPGDTTTSMPDETSTTLPAVPDGPQTFTVTGGTVVVDIQGGVLSLASVTPNAGFTVDKAEARSDRVEVEFRGGANDNDRSRVRVRIDGGRLRIETRDN